MSYIITLKRVTTGFLARVTDETTCREYTLARESLTQIWEPIARVVAECEELRLDKEARERKFYDA